MTVGRSKALARRVSWFFGLGILVVVVMFATHHSQKMAFAQFVLHARPALLLVALLLQMGTYMTDARIWVGIALGIVWVHGDLPWLMALPAGIFAPLAARPRRSCTRRKHEWKSQGRP